MLLRSLKRVSYWGASTSSHQVEGKNHNQWSVWELANAKRLADTAKQRYGHLPIWEDIAKEASTPDNYVSGIAIDHYGRYEEDLDMLAKMNLNAYRFSVEWSRLEPKEGRWDEAQFEHYRQMLRAMKRRDIEPFLTLWHFTLPVWFAEKGGFLHRPNLRYFIRFAEKAIAELGEYINYVIIVNEPNVYAGLSYHDGQWPPQQKSLIATIKVFNNLVQAHKRGYQVIKAINKRFKVGSSLNVIDFYNNDSRVTSRLSVAPRTYFWNWRYFDSIESYSDFLGVNFYMTEEYRSWRPVSVGKKINDLGWIMEPERISDVLIATHNRYKLPIIITENGVADRDDQYRRWWLERTLTAMNFAVNSGVNLVGYTHWSLLDNFEWSHGFWPRFGLVEVDRETLARRLRPSAVWFSEQVKKIRG